MDIQTAETVQMVITVTMFLLVLGFVAKNFFDWKKANQKAELNHKLMDKFTNGQELNAFLATDGGAKFIQSLHFNGHSTIGSAKERILSALKVGVIFIFIGIALFVNGTIFNYEARFFNATAIIAVAVGAGYLVSTIITYILGKKWGIIGGE